MRMLAVAALTGLKRYALFGGIALFAGLLILMLRNPRALGHWALGGVGGCLALGAADALGAYTGVSVALNLCTLGTAFVLGLPGVAALFFLRFFLQI